MRKPDVHRFALFLALLLPGLEAQQPSRIAGRLDNSRRVALTGRVHPGARPQNDLGPVESSFEVPDITIHLKLSADGEVALSRLLQNQQDPASPEYHHWLTPEQYADRFGASESDIRQITGWLQSQGFTVSEVARGRNWIRAGGRAANVRSAFGAEIHRYRVNGVSHYANASNPTVPAALSGLVAGITGLHDFRLRPRFHKAEPRMNNFNGHSLAPDDVATIYNTAQLYNDGVDGRGVKIVVVGQSAIRSSDIDQFRNTFHLPAIDLQQVRATRQAPGVVPGDVDESHLDIEWAGAVARNATIVFVYSSDVWQSALYAVANNLGQVISMSYGYCEQGDLVNQPVYQQAAQQAASQGMTWVAATGDTGAADCEDPSTTIAQNGFAVDSPSSIPEITGVGGTMLDDSGGVYWASTNTANQASALSYIPERVWNEQAPDGFHSGGGGSSVVYPRPLWQDAPGVPGDGGRHVPDVALSSSYQKFGYYGYSGGVLYAGGTSLASPVMAGIVAMVNQYVVSTGAAPQPGLGNINPTLYRLARNNPAVFHDVTRGDNGVACAISTPDCSNGTLSRPAGPGYDMATGLGSIDGYALVHAWSGQPPITSAVVPSIDHNPVFQSGSAWSFTLTLNEEAGIGTTLTDFTVNGVSRAAEIPTLFGKAAIDPRGSIKTRLTLTGLTVPAPVVFGFTGVDAGGANWSTDFSVPFRGPQVLISVGGISNAASGRQVFAPGMILSVYGDGMGEFAQSAAAIPLPLNLAGFQASVNGVPTPLYYVSHAQVNIQIPYETQPGPATLTLGNPFQNFSYRFTVAGTAPGIFTFADDTINPSSSGRRGDVVTLFLTGDGQVAPRLATGTTPSITTPLLNLPKPVAVFRLTVAGIAVTPEFIGIPSGLVGVTQVNFRIPASAPVGLQDVVVTIGDQPSNNAKILVR